MLKVNDLVVNYAQNKVLDKLQLTCEQGAIHGILGMNGAGKTTLFRTIYGFKKPMSGELLFHNKIIAKTDISFMETDSYFYPFMKGYEYLELLSDSGQKFSIIKWNELFELPLNDFIDTYSTGMKKKLAFMGMMAMNRPILILDEPFNGVDIESNEKMLQTIERLRQTDKTILIASHIIESLTRVCDKIHYLKHGLIAAVYDKTDFPKLETELQDMVKGKIDTALEDLLGR